MHFFLQISYFAFIVLFSIILLTNFNPRPDIHAIEYFLIVYVFTLIVEEIRQVRSMWKIPYIQDSIGTCTVQFTCIILSLECESSFVGVYGWQSQSSEQTERLLLRFVERFRRYCNTPLHDRICEFKKMVNIHNVASSYGVFVLQILRFIDNFACFRAARFILAINIMVFCFRFLHIFSVSKNLGPKLVMIQNMVKDLEIKLPKPSKCQWELRGFCSLQMLDMFLFFLILFVFITAYGLASQAMLYPNAPLDFELIPSIWEKAYFQIYGELFLEEIKGKWLGIPDRKSVV